MRCWIHELLQEQRIPEIVKLAHMLGLSIAAYKWKEVEALQDRL